MQRETQLAVSYLHLDWLMPCDAMPTSGKTFSVFLFFSSGLRRTKQKLRDMFPSQDMWLCLVSAAIGAIIAVLVSTLLNIPGKQRKMSHKHPQEHDERLGAKTFYSYDISLKAKESVKSRQVRSVLR